MTHLHNEMISQEQRQPQGFPRRDVVDIAARSASICGVYELRRPLSIVDPADVNIFNFTRRFLPIFINITLRR